MGSGYFLVKLDEPSDGAYRVKLEFEKDAPSDVTFILRLTNYVLWCIILTETAVLL